MACRRGLSRFDGDGGPRGGEPGKELLIFLPLASPAMKSYFSPPTLSILILSDDDHGQGEKFPKGGPPFLPPFLGTC